MMNSSNTMFAPAERAEMKSVRHDAETLQSCVFAQYVIHALPSAFMVMNNPNTGAQFR